MNFQKYQKGIKLLPISGNDQRFHILYHVSDRIMVHVINHLVQDIDVDIVKVNFVTFLLLQIMIKHCSKIIGTRHQY